MTNKDILSNIPVSEIYDYLRQLKTDEQNNEIKTHSKDFCFMLDDSGDYTDDCNSCVINITRTEYFDKFGYLEDCYCDDGIEPYLILPDFLYEICESTYESSLSWLKTREKMLELGFSERCFN